MAPVSVITFLILCQGTAAIAPQEEGPASCSAPGCQEQNLKSPMSDENSMLTMTNKVHRGEQNFQAGRGLQERGQLNVGPLPADCNTFAKSCGVVEHDFSTSWPPHLSTWGDMKEGMINCCIGNGHGDSTCNGIGDELFDAHMGHSFPQGADDTFCRTLNDLQVAHFDWLDDVEHQHDLQLIQQDIHKDIGQRISAKRAVATSLFKHVLDKGFAASAALAQSGEQTLMVLTRGVATYLTSCGSVGWVSSPTSAVPCEGNSVMVKWGNNCDNPSSGCQSSWGDIINQCGKDKTCSKAIEHGYTVCACNEAALTQRGTSNESAHAEDTLDEALVRKARYAGRPSPC